MRKTHKAEMGRKRWVKILLPSSLSFGFGYRPRKKEKTPSRGSKSGQFSIYRRRIPPFIFPISSAGAALGEAKRMPLPDTLWEWEDGGAEVDMWREALAQAGY